MGWFNFMQRRRYPRLSSQQFQKDEAYIFGKGNEEIKRLDMQHFMFRWEFGGDYSAPIRQPSAILDVACGTGRWAREMARRFPRANVIGFDNNQQQIERSIYAANLIGDTLPDNCAFITGNALDAFNFASGSFDFTMARANSAYVPIEKWPDILREMVRVTTTNGWIEVRDFGIVRSQSMALTTMVGFFSTLAAQRGIHPGLSPYIEKYFAPLPLRDKHVRRVTVRSGRHPTRGGRLLIADYLSLLERVTPGIVNTGLTSADQWNQLLLQARHDTLQCDTEVELVSAYGRH